MAGITGAGDGTVVKAVGRFPRCGAVATIAGVITLNMACRLPGRYRAVMAGITGAGNIIVIHIGRFPG